jgi:hypothetical protein
LKRTGFLKGRRHAEANWEKFTRALGEPFFAEVRQAGIAEILIQEPPRTLMADGLRWEPERPEPLTNVLDLFVKGVCKVRNSYVHGEKFVGGDRDFQRDAQLVREALSVLELARSRLLAEEPSPSATEAPCCADEAPHFQVRPPRSS